MQNDIKEYNQQAGNKQGEQVHYDYEQEEENLSPQPRTYETSYEEKPQIELENIIMQRINSLQKEEDLISKQLEVKLQKLLEQITFSNNNSQEKLKMRMHQLALSKILVNTHSKTQFYLVKAHHHLGEAYLNYKCYEQALDHLTMSLKKNAKINDMNEIKLYHSYVLTTYSRCYFEISSYEDALQILKKAHDIQLGCQTQNLTVDNLQTLRLMANCYLKLKKYPESLQSIEKVLTSLENKKVKHSKQYAKATIQKAKILIWTQRSQNQAISSLQYAIQTLHDIKYDNQIQIADYYELLADFYQKVKNYQKQIENLYKKCQIYVQKYEQGHEKTLKVKKDIALLLQKYNKIEQAIKELQQVLEYQEKIYPQNRVQIGKTLKALGLCHMSLGLNLNEAEQYLKRAQKLLSQHGVGKSTRQIKSKLQEIKEKRENKVSSSEQIKTVQRQMNQHSIKTLE